MSATTSPRKDPTHPVTPTQPAEAFPHTFVGLTLGLAALLTLNTVLGPLGFGVIGYDLSASLDNQLAGLELVTVGLVVPGLVLGAVLTVRGRPAAPLIVVAPAAYAAYMFVQYVLGPEYASYSLTALFHLVITAVAGVAGVWVVGAVARARCVAAIAGPTVSTSRHRHSSRRDRSDSTRAGDGRERSG